jgi:hypothetical protein
MQEMNARGLGIVNKFVLDKSHFIKILKEAVFSKFKEILNEQIDLIV